MHVGATTHQGVGDDPLPHPRPPWPRITDLVARYLGSVRRAGQGTLPNGTAGGENDVLRRAGYSGPIEREVGGGEVVDRSVDQVVSAVFSLSSSAPHLYGPELPAFEADLRRLLDETSDHGLFSERTWSIKLRVWRP